MSENNKVYTKEEIIRLHREMWNFIADNISVRRGVQELKKQFCERYGFDDILNHCFCCKWGAQVTGSCLGINMCSECPVIWGNEEGLDNYFCEGAKEDGLYAEVLNASVEGDFRTAKRLAREIADLKVK